MSESYENDLRSNLLEGGRGTDLSFGNSIGTYREDSWEYCRKMTAQVNESEQLVNKICRESFLSLWSYANPLGKNKNELCDTLIVCDPDIIIISVKNIRMTESGNLSTDQNRWHKKAVEASAKQIYGAERWIKEASEVIQSDGGKGIGLPQNESARIYRVAIALGGERRAPFTSGDFGKGFVHVFDRISFDICFEELDTIRDFVGYLSAKEGLYSSCNEILLKGGEEDLLAMYLCDRRQFSNNFDVLVLEDDFWKGYKESDAYKSKKDADHISYEWDGLIEILSRNILHNNMEYGPQLSESEKAVRTMAHENRFGRRVLAQAFRGFYTSSGEANVRSRRYLGPRMLRMSF